MPKRKEQLGHFFNFFKKSWRGRVFVLWTYMGGMPAGGTCQNLHKGFVQGEKEISELLVMDNRYADQFVRGSPILMVNH